VGQTDGVSYGLLLGLMLLPGCTESHCLIMRGFQGTVRPSTPTRDVPHGMSTGM
jgi:hypothetical protein